MKRKSSPKAPEKAPSGDDPMFLNRRPPPGLTSAQFGAAMLVDGLTPHAVVAREWARTPVGPRERMDLTFALERIEQTARRVSAGDLSHAEAVLTAQTVTLNAIFANLACRAVDTTNADHFDRYLRLIRPSRNAGRRSRRWRCSRTRPCSPGRPTSPRSSS